MKIYVKCDVKQQLITVCNMWERKKNVINYMFEHLSKRKAGIHSDMNVIHQLRSLKKSNVWENICVVIFFFFFLLFVLIDQ